MSSETQPNSGGKPKVFTAILTDVHFWIPVAVLAFGVALLVYLG